ncbi:MAG: hypothetical protein RLZZ599_1154 [Bacteroidota bacterium]|jgi:8-oxo-dGTP diphosphatase
MKTIEVVAGIIQNAEGKIFCVQRGENSKLYISKKWEFPGGKLEAGESNEAALIRELQEELKIDVSVGELITTVDHTYPDFRLIMHGYKCTIKDESTPQLTEHLQSRWLLPGELDQLDWAAADVPIVELLR